MNRQMSLHCQGNFESRQTVRVRASIIATVRLGRSPHPGRLWTFAKEKEDANMRSTLLFKAITLSSLSLLASSAVLAQANDATTSNPGGSKVRIVRLSQVKGAVDIDRSIGRGFEPAIANLPVVEKNQLRTGEGIAEIEFEDNSSLRLTPDSSVEFPSLERAATGATISSVHVIRGTAYISLLKPQNGKATPNQFELIFGTHKLALDPATHVRLELLGTKAKLAVLDGSVRVTDANGETIISKKKTATFEVFDQGGPVVAKDVEQTPFDQWDHTAASYHSNVGAMSAFNSPYAYGTSDMSYYGSFMNAGGCGSMWRPYFASAAWSPYSNGSWAWYPGAGYSWVSPYPWAWTAYHSGSWTYCDNVGWGWMPGGGWNGLNNVAGLPPIEGAINGDPVMRSPGRIPHVPAQPPLPHGASVIAVNNKPLATSEIASPTSFVFRKDSAGMGVPRETLGHLGKFSNQAISHGIATTPVYTHVPQTGRADGRMSGSDSMATSVHRGSAPPPGSMPSARDGYSPSPGMGRSGGGPAAGGMAPVNSHVGMSPGAGAPSAPAAPAAPGGVRRSQ